MWGVQGKFSGGWTSIKAVAMLLEIELPVVISMSTYNPHVANISTQVSTMKVAILYITLFVYHMTGGTWEA